jgi:hypothetical protein
MAALWVVAPCSLVEVYRRFRGTCCHRQQGPDDGVSTYLWNVGLLLPVYTALQPRRQPSSSRRRENLKSYVFFLVFDHYKRVKI